MPSCTTCTHNISHHLAISFANWQSLGQPTGGFQFMASTSSSRLCHTISSIETYWNPWWPVGCFGYPRLNKNSKSSIHPAPRQCFLDIELLIWSMPKSINICNNIYICICIYVYVHVHVHIYINHIYAGRRSSFRGSRFDWQLLIWDLERKHKKHLHVAKGDSQNTEMSSSIRVNRYNHETKNQETKNQPSWGPTPSQIDAWLTW
jgi:hypothetical protein